MSKLNLYYVGSSEIAAKFVNGENHSWTGSLETMTEKAIGRVANGSEKTAIIVKIVRIIRRASPPVIVEDIDETLDPLSQQTLKVFDSIGSGKTPETKLHIRTDGNVGIGGDIENA